MRRYKRLVYIMETLQVRDEGVDLDDDLICGLDDLGCGTDGRAYKS